MIKIVWVVKVGVSKTVWSALRDARIHYKDVIEYKPTLYPKVMFKSTFKALKDFRGM